jgi:hypothetical protein
LQFSQLRTKFESSSLWQVTPTMINEIKIIAIVAPLNH